MESARPPHPPEPGPALWNPDVAGCWSILFSPAFGSFLHARNAEALGRTEEASTNWRWFYGTLIFLGVSLAASFLPLPAILFQLSGIAVLLAWYFSTGQAQSRFIKGAYGKNYPKKSWGLPLLVAVGGLLIYFVISIIAGVIYGYIYYTATGHAPTLS